MTLLASVQKLQALALACTSSDVNIRAAPDYPVTNADVLPLSVAHLSTGEGTFTNADTLRFNPVVYVDFHFPRTFTKKAYADMDEICLTYMQRLHGSQIVGGTPPFYIISPVLFSVDSAATYDQIDTFMLRFEVTLKALQVPVST